MGERARYKKKGTGKGDAKRNYAKGSSTFAGCVYTYCAKVPQGKVTTYGEIARALGTRGYRAIGQALRCNPYAPKVPCHRVVKSDGSLGGFMGQMNGEEVLKKISLLQQEGVKIKEGKVNLEKYLFRF